MAPEALTLIVTSFLAPVFIPVISIMVVPSFPPALSPVLTVKIPTPFSSGIDVVFTNQAISKSLDVAA